MNIILLQSRDFISPNSARIAGPRASHIRTVLRARMGQRVKVGVLNGQLGTAVLTAVTADEFTLSVELTHNPPPPSPLRLLLALPRPKMLRRILRTIAELGIKELTLINSYRVEKSYWQSPALRKENIDACLLTGLAQAGDTRLPVVNFEKRFKPFVQDRLGSRLTGHTAYVAHPGASSIPIPGVKGATFLAVGPEGGFIPYEIDQLLAAGLQATSLGSRIMRVETAIPYAVAALTATGGAA